MVYTTRDGITREVRDFELWYFFLVHSYANTTFPCHRITAFSAPYQSTSLLYKQILFIFRPFARSNLVYLAILDKHIATRTVMRFKDPANVMLVVVGQL